MHPAPSIIFFTAASGAGYGLLFAMASFAAAGALPGGRAFALAGFGLGFALITLGLVASAFHLGHPERAWRAFSQWRTSWLSREGVAALATYPVAGLFAIDRVFPRPGAGVDGQAVALASASALMCVLTVVCTAMIYASLKPIRRWCNPWVVPNYLALALATGALWLNALGHLFGGGGPAVAWLAVGAVAAAWLLKQGYWRFIDGDGGGGPTAESATGLGALGAVRLLDAPHTSENYLLKEMGYRIARKHARKLRRVAVGAGFAAPLGLTLAAIGLDGGWAAAAALLAAALGSAGAVVERWLFFAEAKHSVTLYYGARSA